MAEVVEFSPYARTVILQPTPLCNMRCVYCYLPDLSDRRRMDPAIPRLLTADFATYPPNRTVEVCWHAGEPLAVGAEGLSALLEPFEPLRRAGRVRHSLQTNATLVTPQWCDLFLRYNIDVGVSIDGPRWANGGRRTLSGAETFTRALVGIDCVRGYGVPFSVIAVVSLATIPTIIDRAAEYLAFFASLGASAVGFNVEETEGRHIAPNDPAQVRRFWQAIFDAWLAAEGRPAIRDFDRVLIFAEASLRGRWRVARPDLFPTVMCDGDVVLLSPELAGYDDHRLGDFKVGNVHDEPLSAILRRGPSAPYVQEFMEGTAQCEATCRYFDYCGGGQAANRYFEHRNFATNETVFCQHSRQAPFDVVLGMSDGDDDSGRSRD